MQATLKGINVYRERLGLDLQCPRIMITVLQKDQVRRKGNNEEQNREDM